jgi:hypothetical protein
LFKNLFIHDKWNWEKNYPVIRINFAADIKNIERFFEVVYNQLKLNYENFEIEFNNQIKHSGLLLENLIIKVNKKYNKKVVLLVLHITSLYYI